MKAVFLLKCLFLIIKNIIVGDPETILKFRDRMVRLSRFNYIELKLKN